MSVLPWLVCPSCEYDDFEDEHLQDDEAVCPECGASTPIQEMDDEPSMDDLMDSLRSREPTAHDEPEVQDGELVFEHDETFYRAGTEPFYCPDCGQECERSCGSNGRSDVAYCTSCHIRFERDRTELVDDVSSGLTTETRAEEREAYEEYDCEYCDETHPYTRPDGTYKRPSQRVQSYERAWFECLCGATLSGAFEPHQQVNCGNCPRVYTLNVEFFEDVAAEYDAFHGSDA